MITFEGIDCSGKSVQAERLLHRLVDHHLPAVMFREPGGCDLSEAVRELLLDRKYRHMSARAEALLYSAARAQLVAEKIRPAMEQGKVVICDRFYDSTTAYQGYGRGLQVDFLAELNRFATAGLTPDRTFLLDLEPAEALARRIYLGQGDDRMEAEDAAFHQRVREGYLELAKAEPERIRVINAAQPIDRIADEIWPDVADLLHLKTDG